LAEFELFVESKDDPKTFFKASKLRDDSHLTSFMSNFKKSFEDQTKEKFDLIEFVLEDGTKFRREKKDKNVREKSIEICSKNSNPYKSVPDSALLQELGINRFS
jgi:hypothetical protein